MTTRPGPSEGWPTYMADWRERHPDAVVENRLRERARSRAKSQLAAMHPEDFEMLYDAELEQVRLDWAAEQDGEGRSRCLDGENVHSRKHGRANVQRKRVRNLIALAAELPIARREPLPESAGASENASKMGQSFSGRGDAQTPPGLATPNEEG